MKTDDIKELIELLKESDLSKLSYKKGDFEVHLERSFSSSAPVQTPPPVASSPAAPSESGKFVTSPMVGTFYAASAPDQPPFVKVGDVIQKGQIVCIIEAMKVMNEVKANESGKIVEVLVQNGQAVEFSERLFKVE